MEDRKYRAYTKEFKLEALELRRAMNILKKISQFVVTRLKTIFPAVAEKPLPLRNSKYNPLYLLCFAAGNPKGSATALRIANNLLTG